MNPLQVKDALVETTMVKDVALQRILAMKERETAMDLETVVPMTVTLGAREILCVAPTTVSSLAPTSIPRMTAVSDQPVLVQSSVQLQEVLGRDSRILVGDHGAPGPAAVWTVGWVRPPGRGSVWAGSVEHPYSTSLKIRREFVRENVTISSHNLNIFIMKTVLYYFFV